MTILSTDFPRRAWPLPDVRPRAFAGAWWCRAAATARCCPAPPRAFRPKAYPRTVVRGQQSTGRPLLPAGGWCRAARRRRPRCCLQFGCRWRCGGVSCLSFDSKRWRRRPRSSPLLAAHLPFDGLGGDWTLFAGRALSISTRCSTSVIMKRCRCRTDISSGPEEPFQQRGPGGARARTSPQRASMPRAGLLAPSMLPCL